MGFRELLQKPIDGMNSGNFQEKFKFIAQNLFKKCYISCGDKKYYFAEIEFYYFDKDKNKGLNNSWNEKTYPRDGKEAGKLFFHNSGVDICFDSSFEDGKFGGILIRSLKTENGKFITGPWVCMFEMLNASSVNLPKLELLKEENENKDYILCDNPIPRWNITYKENVKDEPLCFYDKNLYDMLSKNNNKEIFENARWDYGKNKDGGIKGTSTLNRYYRRFEKK